VHQTVFCRRSIVHKQMPGEMYKSRFSQALIAF
jgi:hypothetical protein